MPGTGWLARCFACNHEFSAYRLGSFQSYGEVAVQRDDGKVWGHLAYFDPTPFDEVQSIISDLDLYAENADNLQIMKQVLARCADLSDGLRWYYGDHFCPRCGGSADIAGEDGPDRLDIRELVYDEFRTLSSEDKHQLVAEMWKEIRSRPIERALQAVRDQMALDIPGENHSLSVRAEDADRYVIGYPHFSWTEPIEVMLAKPWECYEVVKGTWRAHRINP